MDSTGVASSNVNREGIAGVVVVDVLDDCLNIQKSRTITLENKEELIPTPSVDRVVAPELIEEDIQSCSTVSNEDLDMQCDINKRLKRCMRHACEVRMFEVTTKKWQWIRSKN